MMPRKPVAQQAFGAVLGWVSQVHQQVYWGLMRFNLTIKNGDLTIKNGDLTVKNGD